MLRTDPHPADPGALPAERKLGSLMAVAVLASLIASTCCVLPLVLVLVGVGGAWVAGLQSFKPVTPYAYAVTLAALGWAGWLVFRPGEACSIADGSTGVACATTRPVVRRIWIGCALFVAALLGFPLAAPLFY
jgi:mercuric ion transport protein